MPIAPPEPVLVAVALVHRAGRWLVARRPDHVHLGGLWEFPGGKCQPGESPESTALRELAEECAVQARVLERWPEIVHQYPARTVRMTPVLCEWLAGEPRTLGNEECRWVTSEQFTELHWPAANQPLLDQLRKWRAAEETRPLGPRETKPWN